MKSNMMWCIVVLVSLGMSNVVQGFDTPPGKSLVVYEGGANQEVPPQDVGAPTPAQQKWLPRRAAESAWGYVTAAPGAAWRGIKKTPGLVWNGVTYVPRTAYNYVRGQPTPAPGAGTPPTPAQQKWFARRAAESALGYAGAAGGATWRGLTYGPRTAYNYVRGQPTAAPEAGTPTAPVTPEQQEEWFYKRWPKAALGYAGSAAGTVGEGMMYAPRMVRNTPGTIWSYVPSWNKQATPPEKLETVKQIARRRKAFEETGFGQQLARNTLRGVGVGAEAGLIRGTYNTYGSGSGWTGGAKQVMRATGAGIVLGAVAGGTFGLLSATLSYLRGQNTSPAFIKELTKLDETAISPDTIAIIDGQTYYLAAGLDDILDINAQDTVVVYLDPLREQRIDCFLRVADIIRKRPFYDIQSDLYREKEADIITKLGPVAYVAVTIEPYSKLPGIVIGLRRQGYGKREQIAAEYKRDLEKIENEKNGELQSLKGVGLDPEEQKTYEENINKDYQLKAADVTIAFNKLKDKIDQQNTTLKIKDHSTANSFMGDLALKLKEDFPGTGKVPPYAKKFTDLVSYSVGSIDANRNKAKEALYRWDPRRLWR
jgi:hypothetical protein